MATLLDIIAADMHTRSPLMKNDVIKNTVKEYKEVLLAITDIADRIVNYDLGDLPPNGQITAEEFETMFTKCMGRDALTPVMDAIHATEFPRLTDLNYLMGREIVLHAITDYKTLMDKVVLGIATKYLQRR